MSIDSDRGKSFRMTDRETVKHCINILRALRIAIKKLSVISGGYSIITRTNLYLTNKSSQNVEKVFLVSSDLFS